MFRSLADFRDTWNREAQETLKLFRGIPDTAMGQSVSATGRNLGFLAWHITVTVAEMMNQAGVPVQGPDEHSAVPKTMVEIAAAYERSANNLLDILPTHWTDAQLSDMVAMYGEQWPKKGVLFALIAHQIHHRGQMTVLMRQAGLAVPGMYGPASEEWAAMGMPPQP